MATSKVGLTTNAITGILPTANGGTGNTSGAAITATANGADNRVATYSSTTALNGEANLTYTGSVLKVNTTDAAAHGNADDLIVGSSSGNHGITIYSQNNATGNIHFSDGTAGADQYRGQINYDHTANNLQFHTDGSEKVRITSEASLPYVKVGIGETSPLGILHVKSADSGATVNANFDEFVIENSADSGMTILSGTGNTGGIMFGDSGDNDIGKIEYTHTDNIMKFTTGAAEKMRILSGGQVIITDNNFAGTPLGDDAAAQNSRFQVKGRSGEEIAVFQTASNGRQIQFYNAGATYVGGIAINSGDTTYATSSDYRLKENETSITDGIDRIKQLKPYRFNFKTDTNKTVDGFFAHEVSSIVPEAITGEKDAMHPEVLYTDEILYTDEDELPEGKSIGDVKHSIGDVKEATSIKPQGIDQSKLVPLLVASLQEAITKIETLETANTDLTTRITALENA